MPEIQWIFSANCAMNEIEDAAISIRRSRKSVKLPDALIIATARVHHVRLVTLDQDLEKLGMWLDATVR